MNSTIPTETFRKYLKSQYHASLAMLKQAIERCPDELWTSDQFKNPFWQNAYHTLFYTHMYLQPNEEAFKPWQHHREEYQFMGKLPWPPHNPARIGDPYTKEQVLEYWQFCDQIVDSAVDALDLHSPECGFWWYGKFPKAEHQFNNIRHIQHHVGQLADRLGPAEKPLVIWRGV